MISERKSQAMEIMNQLGGQKFIAMTGARYITFDEKGPTANLSFKFMGSKAATHMKIALDVMDTYTVTFYKIRGATCKTVKEYTGVYNDMLRDIFTSFTGLETSLGTMGA